MCSPSVICDVSTCSPPRNYRRGVISAAVLRDPGVNYTKRGVEGVKGHSVTRFEQSWRNLERLLAELMLETSLSPALSALLADLH